MPELLPLDTAAAAVGKSEVTLRRLVKAGKIPAEREQTITGFIYRVDPEVIKAYYAEREKELEVAPPTKFTEPNRLAVSTSAQGNEEYWRKRAERYEQKYDESIKAHLQTKEALGLWKGKAEQLSSAVQQIAQPTPPKQRPVKVPANLEVPTQKEVTSKKEPIISWLSPIVLGLIVSLAIAGGIVATQLH